ncbi:MAG: metallophosphoesterase [Phocaeicola sp.]
MIDKTELFFTTLWTKISTAEIVSVQMGLTDCRRIVYNGAGFTSQDYAILHQTCIDWLAEALASSTAKSKVVITHHQPTTLISDPRFKSSPINSAFVVPMDDFIEESEVDYWIYGHTHYNTNTQTVIGKTILLCNQLGYVRHSEHSSFSNDSYILT